MSSQDSLTNTPTDHDISRDGINIPTTPREVDLVHEIRTANAQLTAQISARLDGFNLRLGAMERHQRVQEDILDSPSPSSRLLPINNSANTAAPTTSQSQQARGSQEDEAPPASLTINRGAHRARSQPTIPPHMGRTAAALASPTISPPQRMGTASSITSETIDPLARYRSMTKGEKSNVRRALAGLGLSVPTLMSMFPNSADDDDISSTAGTNDDVAMSTAADTRIVDRPSPTTVETQPIQTSIPQPTLTSASTPSDPLAASQSVPTTTPTITATPITDTPPASTPQSRIDPAPNIPAQTHTSPTTVSTRPMTCKTEWIGDYDGDPTQLEDFLTRLRDLIRSETQKELVPAWITAVLRTLPRTLKGNAAVWHQGLSDDDAAELTSFDAWCAAMRAAFPVNRQQLRREARSRKWRTTEETAAAYYFHKVRLLRQAFGKDQSEDALVTDIKDGLPETMVALLRLPRDKATLAELVFELGDWEPNWRVQYKVPLRGSVSSAIPSTISTPQPILPAQANPTLASRLFPSTMGRSASAPATPAVTGIKTPSATTLRAAPSHSANPRPMSKFAAAYDPSRIIPAQNGQPRRYRPPGKDTVMDLRAPCSYCGEDHFNFEHDYLVPQVRTMVINDDEYEEYPWDGNQEEDGEGGHDGDDPSLSLESGIAPSMFTAETTKIQPTLASMNDDTSDNTSAPTESPSLFFADKPVFSVPRTLRPNESAPPLAQEKRAFGNVVTLPQSSATGTGQGYRNHVPLSMHVRVNDTDGRAMSTLLDTGASLSCIDESLLTKMGGKPTGSPMNVHGIGSSRTLGWVTLPIFIAAQDPHGKHVQLEILQDFHVLPSFPPGMCLGLDFIDSHRIHISSVRGRARTGRYFFQVHERWDKGFTAEAELHTTAAVTIEPRTQVWVQVDATCLAPGVDYTVAPRLSVTPDQSVCLTGPNGVLTHGSDRHILLGNYGDESFHLERDTIIADAAAARVGEVMTAAEGSIFTLQPMPTSSTAPISPPLSSSASDEPGMPFDPFEDDSPSIPSLTQDATTIVVDDAFRVGVDDNGEAHPDLVALLRQHRAAFALDGRPGQVDDANMEIRLQPDSTLHSEAPRRAGPDKRAAMDAAIDQLLDWDVIEPSNSPVSFPVVMVKQHSKWRFCVDYRKLNTTTVPDRYPLPTIDAIFHTLCGKKLFSSLDAIRGYHQLGIQASDRWKTAFICHRGLFQYKRIPFGLRNAPAFFQRFMDKILGPLRWNQAVVYIDDAVVATDTMEEHLDALRQLFDSAEAVGLKFSPSKCTFAVPSLTLLGRKVSGAGVAIWKDRAKAVEELPRPTTLQELYHVLGLFGYYRAFIPRFAEMASPLTSLLKGWRYESSEGQSRLVNTEGKPVTASKVPITWDTPQQTSFDALKGAISSPPVLAHPDPSRPYILYTDASKDALAAIIHQVHPESAPSSTVPMVGTMHHLSVQQLPSAQARDRWQSWLEADAHFGPILQRVRNSTVADDEWVFQQGVLVRRLDDKVALPMAAVPFIMRAVHDGKGHFGFTKSFLAVSKQFWRPQLSSLVRSWVKHCPVCQQTKSVPKVGSLDISQDASFPFEAIAVDLLFGFPRSQSGNDAVLAILDLFSRMILLTPCHKDITAEGIAAIVADRVLRMGWRPRRIISDSEYRVSGSVMSSLAASLGAVSTPSSPYHQQANAVERAVQTVQQVVRTMTVDSRAHWDKRVLPAVELAMNSTPAITTGFRPFDLIFLSHPDVVHAVFDSQEHLGVHSFDERMAAGAERLREARDHILSARNGQKRRYDARRATIPELRAGMRVWIRLKDRPVPGAIRDKLDSRKLGPFEVAEVLSPHRVRLNLPDDLDLNPVLNVEQLDFLPTVPDPFVDARAPLTSDAVAAIAPPPSSSESVAAPSPSIPPTEVRLPRARHLPHALRDFMVGTVSTAVESDDLHTLLHAPIGRPRRVLVDGLELVLTERPVAYLSRLTGVAEKKLVAPELELVCLAWAFHKLAHLLEGASVTVVTDHAPMERMLNSTTGIAYGPTITRCRTLLLPHLDNLRFVYRPGPRHTNVDALSRLPIDQGRSSSAAGHVLAE
ncbi:hypothetical protein A4X13_0g7791 [Tilletia indica]|uniref:RNA-directed DNA polymerase n=1 Tax=Tilletia indica TaxID=43049 RepID=A0A177TC34_9BASI|nr:hypothetical protein A4X13_0g7791 [Tilletia indica]